MKINACGNKLNEDVCTCAMKIFISKVIIGIVIQVSLTQVYTYTLIYVMLDFALFNKYA